MHSTVLNTDPSWVNDADPAAGFAGIPRKMTTVASLMKKAGYTTTMTGKWGAFSLHPQLSELALRQ